MSTEARIKTEITNRAILLDTFKELNITSTQISDDVFAWGQGYDRMKADLTTGELTYDSMRLEQVNILKKTYSKNLVIDSILKKGHHVVSKNVLADGRIEIVAKF